MTYFDTLVNSKKERVPTPPKIFQRIGYDNYRYPFVVNFFTLEGYGVYLKKIRKGFSVCTDGWSLGDSLATCVFPCVAQVFELAVYDTYVSAVEKFSDVCSVLCKCYRFDYIKEAYYYYILAEAERLAYTYHDVDTAERILHDKFDSPYLFEEFE